MNAHTYAQAAPICEHTSTYIEMHKVTAVTFR